ncbi:YcaO-like family protein [Sinorhizobium sp. BG8]|uniref:YcaO-like family protein n=1 Tax=Sinorhizobium sp. BG8 TaxID=2613773 RepID=UPI0032B247BC
MQHLRNLEQLLHRPLSPQPETWETVRRILARRREFGITRLGSVTGLDRAGIEVVQVIRPASRSVAVNMGKGLTYAAAAISGLMESLEGWASERIAADRAWMAELGETDGDGIWSHLPPSVRESHADLSWIDGWDLLSAAPRPVPLALVDTAYIVPSPHPHGFARDTTGLAAGTSLQQAMAHACFEILERHAHCMAMATPHFFDRFQIDTEAIRSGKAGEVMGRLAGAGFAVGAWTVPAGHDLPIYWCHVMEGAGHAPLAPLPAAGFGCDLTHDRALSKALLEACQSRLGVISSAREDVSGHLYQPSDRREMVAWRESLSKSALPYCDAPEDCSSGSALEAALHALKSAGAAAVIAVVLHSDESIPLHVVRIVAPPLQTNPELYDEQ